MIPSLLLLAASLLVCVNAAFREQLHTGRAFADGASSGSIARHLVHDAGYTALISTQFYDPKLKEYGGANVQLLADGPEDKGTGIPYFYMHKHDPSVLSSKQNNRAAVFLTEGVIEGRCDNFPLGIKDEACPRAELFGTMEEVHRSSDEFKKAHGWFVQKYPALGELGEKDHDYELWKLNVKTVLIGKDGKPAEVPVDEYFSAEPAVWVDSN